jgi:hypothetical protein
VEDKGVILQIFHLPEAEGMLQPPDRSTVSRSTHKEVNTQMDLLQELIKTPLFWKQRELSLGRNARFNLPRTVENTRDAQDN